LFAGRNSTWLLLQLADGNEVMAWQWRPYPGGAATGWTDEEMLGCCHG